MWGFLLTRPMIGVRAVPPCPRRKPLRGLAGDRQTRMWSAQLDVLVRAELERRIARLPGGVGAVGPSAQSGRAARQLVLALRGGQGGEPRSAERRGRPRGAGATGPSVPGAAW